MVCFALFIPSTNAQTLISYWDFNNNSSAEALLTPSLAMLPNTNISVNPGTQSVLDFTGGTGQNFDIENLNARNGSSAGAHLRFNNPIGGSLIFSLPTNGFQNLIVKFATRRSGQGAGTQTWSYSTDGTSYTLLQTVQPNNGDPTLISLDLAAISQTNNNPNFKLRVEFEQGTGGTTGNNRFDNFTLEGIAIPSAQLVHYWNFNNSSTIETVTAVSATLVAGANIAAIPGGISAINLGGTGQDFDLENLNARNGDAAGTHLRFNDPIGGVLEFSVPTTGFNDLIVKFATRRSTQGAGNQIWSYTTNGTDFITLTTIQPVAAAPTLQTLDFTEIPEADNNPNFKLRVAFEQGAGGTSGNNRFDNFTVEGTPISGTDEVAPVVTFTPSNNASNVAAESQIVLQFNENIRLVNDNPITAENVAQIVALKLNNANGNLVPFTAAVTENTITITPSAPLNFGQTYYVELQPNAVEDFANNAITTLQSVSFTTISQQTLFNAGDLAFVGYRMNATATEDEIALVTFVDILPGTLIQLTDSKFTTNPQPLCSGAITWTASATVCIPAGSVITIQTSALTSNLGTVTGNGFGLSSNGDQVIVYSGTAENPNFITALSSNTWVAGNTSCSGSFSLLPTGLVLGQTAISGVSFAGSTLDNSVNAFYNGPQTGSYADIKAAIYTNSNWVATAAGTAAQVWPTFAFPGALQVQSAVVLNATTIQVTFNADINTSSAQNVQNYTGIAGLQQASAAANVVTLQFNQAFVSGTSYSLIISNIADQQNNLLACPFTFNFTFNTTIAFDKAFLKVNEDAGTLTIDFDLTGPASASVELAVKPAAFNTTNANDFSFTSQIINISPTSTLTQSVTIPITNDSLEEQHAEYFVLELINPQNVSIVGNQTITVYIIDNDSQAPQPTNQIELNYVGSFDPSGSNSSTCEIVVHDEASQRLFTTSAVAGKLDIIDFSNPANPTLVSSIDMNVYGGLTSVAVKNGIVAAASPAPVEQDNGSVVFFDTNGTFISQVSVGALPDMITFTPDGTKVLTANEGQPNDAYTIDPEGSVSIIDISNGVQNLQQANVQTLLFTSFNAQESELVTAGVRKLKSSSTLSQDFEPEYIAISADSQKAWVSLQENNAIAEINLATATISGVWPLGVKDMSIPGNGFDASDNNNEVLIANWPVESYYIPDAIANYTVNGISYLVTANEGDEKEYAGLNERTTVGANSFVLDPTNFPNSTVLKQSFNLGRFRVTNLNGNEDADAEFEKIRSVGTRSFSIFDANAKQLVYDSGDDFERYTLATIPQIFNADHESNTPKVRSRSKGPEAEGVALAQIADQTFAFISLERVGGVMVYNVTDPLNPIFVDYKNSRSTSAYAGDHGAEGITYITKEQSPDEFGYILVANEISGTITIYAIDENELSISNPIQNRDVFALFPNPTSGGIVYLNKVSDIRVFDLQGKLLKEQAQTLTLDVSGLSSGIYIVQNETGITRKLIVK